MNTSPTDATAGGRVCPECGTRFTCEIAAGKTECWCFGLPNVMSLDDDRSKGCLCPNCLQQQIESIQAQHHRANQ